MNGNDQEWLQNRIAAAVADDYYLDRGEEQRIKEESAARGIATRDCELVLREGLEAHAAVSERLLIAELDRLLHQFTDRDKKLDPKEERDALGKVVTKAPGKKAGLDPRVAEEYVATFCKANGATRSTDRPAWLVPAAVAAGVAVLAVGALLMRKDNAPAPQAAAQAEPAIHQVAAGVRLNDADKAEIDDQLRRAQQYVEAAQYTDPPEKSAKACLDQIKQIDPEGAYRGGEVKALSSRIVTHYLALADGSAAAKDMQGAEKWLARARLLRSDRELILEKERALGLARAEH
jgi:hypothetical protein